MTVIDDYLKDATPAQRKILEHIRRLVKQIVPDAEETISYGIPTLKYKGTYLLYFAFFKNHLSVFPGGAIADKLKPRLNGYKIAKGTIRFTTDNPLPDAVIKDIVKLRLEVINRKTR